VISHLRLLAIALTATVIVLSAFGHASVSQSVTSGAVGVLVGLERLGEDVSGAPRTSTLRTLWIPLGHTAPIKALDVVEIADLLVPRHAGFWRAGRLTTCGEGPLDSDNKELTAAWVAEYLWAAPHDRRPRVQLGTRDFQSPYPERVGPCRAKRIYCDVDRRVGIYWIAPEYMSLDLGVRGSCGPHPGWTPEFGIRSLDDVHAPLAVGALLGLAAEQAFLQAYEQARADYVRALKSQVCADTTFDPTTWWIEREAGSWTMKGWVRHERYCNYGFDFSADLDVSRITGRADDRTRWQTLHASRPVLDDAHFLPGGRWVLGLTRTQLFVFDGDVPRPVLTLPLTNGDSIVMVEWATGRNVARWDAEVRRVRRRGPVNPVVVR
jgi:hypothetical protein